MEPSNPPRTPRQPIAPVKVHTTSPESPQTNFNRKPNPRTGPSAGTSMSNAKYLNDVEIVHWDRHSGPQLPMVPNRNSDTSPLAISYHISAYPRPLLLNHQEKSKSKGRGPSPQSGDYMPSDVRVISEVHNISPESHSSTKGNLRHSGSSVIPQSGGSEKPKENKAPNKVPRIFIPPCPADVLDLTHSRFVSLGITVVKELRRITMYEMQYETYLLVKVIFPKSVVQKSLEYTVSKSGKSILFVWDASTSDSFGFGKYQIPRGFKLLKRPNDRWFQDTNVVCSSFIPGTQRRQYILGKQRGSGQWLITAEVYHGTDIQSELAKSGKGSAQLKEQTRYPSQNCHSRVQTGLNQHPAGSPCQGPCLIVRIALTKYTTERQILAASRALKNKVQADDLYYRQQGLLLGSDKWSQLLFSMDTSISQTRRQSSPTFYSSSYRGSHHSCPSNESFIMPTPISNTEVESEIPNLPQLVSDNSSQCSNSRSYSDDSIDVTSSGQVAFSKRTSGKPKHNVMGGSDSLKRARSKRSPTSSESERGQHCKPSQKESRICSSRFIPHSKFASRKNTQVKTQGQTRVAKERKVIMRSYQKRRSGRRRRNHVMTPSGPDGIVDNDSSRVVSIEDDDENYLKNIDIGENLSSEIEYISDGEEGNENDQRKVETERGELKKKESNVVTIVLSDDDWN